MLLQRQQRCSRDRATACADEDVHVHVRARGQVVHARRRRRSPLLTRWQLVLAPRLHD